MTQTLRNDQVLIGQHGVYRDHQFVVKNYGCD